MEQPLMDETIKNLTEVQRRNLELLARLNGLSYGGNSEDSGYYLIDLNTVNTEEGRRIIFEKTSHLLSSDQRLRDLQIEGKNESISLSPVDLVEAEDYPNSFVTFPKRINIRTYPVPTEICGTANSFTFADGWSLTQAGSGFPNTKALALATTDVTFGKEGDKKTEKWLYVRIHNLEGWVPASETQAIEDDSMVVDSLRPLENQQKFGEKLGIITAYGLKEVDGKLVPVDPKLANGELDPNNLPARGEESLGDGTMREGENSLLTLGDAVEIVGDADNQYIVKINGKNLLIEKSLVNRGYLEVNGVNIAAVLNSLVHPNPADPKSFAPYGWGGEDGVNFDCSLMVDVLTRTFGITVGRGADPQRFGVEGAEFKITDSFHHQVSIGDRTEEYESTLPLKFEDLPSEVQSQYDSQNNIFTKIVTVSCGPHIMVMHSVDKDGNIIYVHSVGFVNKIGVKAKGEKVGAHPVWSIVKGPAVYSRFNDTNGDLELVEDADIYSWGDSYPPYVAWDEESRKAWPASYIVIH